MHESNGGYMPHNRHSDNAIHHQQAMDQNYVQRQQRRQHGNSGQGMSDDISLQGMTAAEEIGNTVSFHKDDEPLRLLQQLAAEQSELLDRLNGVNPSATAAASASVLRPNEQYLTIALNGKSIHDTSSGPCHYIHISGLIC